MTPTTQPILLTIEANQWTPTPVPTATPLPRPTPMEWCDPALPEPGVQCFWPELTPPAVVTPRPPSPTPTVQPCGPGAEGGEACIWPAAGVTVPAATPATVRVPDVLTLALPDAATDLAAAGLDATVACSPSFADATEPGTVYRTVPPPGTRVPRGSRVIVSVEPPCAGGETIGQ